MPAFFDIMIHLPVHLATEALIGGPVLYRQMYPIEQYMRTLKGYVRNKCHSKASISQSYLINESISLCATYFQDSSVHMSPQPPSSLAIFSSIKELSSGSTYIYESGDRELTHSYVLKNCEEAESFYRYESSQIILLV